MSRPPRLLAVAIAIVAALLVSDARLKAAAPAPAPRTDQVGKTFLFDYGDLVVASATSPTPGSNGSR